MASVKPEVGRLNRVFCKTAFVFKDECAFVPPDTGTPVRGVGCWEGPRLLAEGRGLD